MAFLRVSMSLATVGQSFQPMGPVQASRGMLRGDWWVGVRGGGVLGGVGLIQVQAAPHQPFPVEAGQPFLHVDGVLGAALLAVVDDVDAGGKLPVNDAPDSFPDASGEQVRVGPGAFLPFPQELL